MFDSRKSHKEQHFLHVNDHFSRLILFGKTY
jgi:hypothetical protein